MPSAAKWNWPLFEAARWSTSALPSTGLGSPSAPIVRSGEGGVGGDDRARGIDDRRHQPGLAHPPAGLAGDQPPRLAGDVGFLAALQPPEQVTADQPHLAAHHGAGERQRRHHRAMVAVRGADRRQHRLPVAVEREFGGRCGGAEPLAPGAAGADQGALAVGQRQRHRRRRAVERGAQQRRIVGGGRQRRGGRGRPAQGEDRPGPDQPGEEGAGEERVADRPEQQRRRGQGGGAEQQQRPVDPPAGAAGREGAGAGHPYQMRTRRSGAR